MFLKRIELQGFKSFADKTVIQFDHDITGIVGPNGCGKTTFLKTVYRITKPDLGAIYLDGKPLDNISIRKSAQNMAVVAQFNNLNFDCSVLDVVMLGRTPHLKLSLIHI